MSCFCRPLVLYVTGARGDRGAVRDLHPVAYPRGAPAGAVFLQRRPERFSSAAPCSRIHTSGSTWTSWTKL